MTDPQRLTLPPMTTVSCRKVCRECGQVWQGQFFKEWAKAEVLTLAVGQKAVRSVCGGCITKWEVKRERMDIESLISIIVARAGDAPKYKIPGILRSQVAQLKRLRSTYTAGSDGFGRVSQRIFAVDDALQQAQ
jgi:hypothetical protein